MYTAYTVWRLGSFVRWMSSDSGMGDGRGFRRERNDEREARLDRIDPELGLDSTADGRGMADD